MFICSLIAALMLLDGFELKPVFPEDNEVYLEQPGDIMVDLQDRIHVLDMSAKTIHVWNADRTYVGNYGSPGEGPGELSFEAPMGGPQGYLGEVDGNAYVYDGGARKIHIFDENLQFVRSMVFNIPAGKLEEVAFIEADRTLAFYSSYLSETPYRRVVLLKDPETEIAELAKAPDDTWYYRGSDANRTIVLRVYGAQFIVGYDELRREVLVGHSSEPRFDVFDLEGKKTKTVAMDLARRELTKEDRAEFTDSRWFKNQSGFDVDFPDQWPYYDLILPFGKRGYLVSTFSPVDIRLQGMFVDLEGNSLAPFRYTCGSGGGIYAKRGRLFIISIPEGEDDLAMWEVIPPKG